MNTEHLRERLEEEKRTLEAELATIGRRNPSNPSDWEARSTETGQEADPTDQASILDSFQENHAILAALEPRYDSVLAALARMTDGTYGTCIVGGEPIEEARLTADPAAATCKAHIS
ncbi:MAG: TraR/DksA family transcriptional regulator [Bacillota bacterium]